MFRMKFVENIKTTFYIQQHFANNCALFRWKTGVEADRSQITIYYGTCALHNWSCKHILRICSIHCLKTATMATRTRVNVTLYIHSPFCQALNTFFLLASPILPQCMISVIIVYESEIPFTRVIRTFPPSKWHVRPSCSPLCPSHWPR